MREIDDILDLLRERRDLSAAQAEAFATHVRMGEREACIQELCELASRTPDAARRDAVKVCISLIRARSTIDE